MKTNKAIQYVLFGFTLLQALSVFNETVAQNRKHFDHRENRLDRKEDFRDRREIVCDRRADIKYRRDQRN